MADEELGARHGDYQPMSTQRSPTVVPSKHPNSSIPVPFTPNTSSPGTPTPSGVQNAGGRPPHPHGIASESQTNTIRRIIRNLESQINDLRGNNRLLQVLVNNQVNEILIPNVAKWEFIKPHMKKNSKKLILEVDVNKCRMFPHEEHMKEEILAISNAVEGVMFKLSAFERAWEESLKTKVKVTIINRRGRFASYARLELWRFLGVPKPRNGNSTEIESWKDSLKPLFRHNNWRWKDGDLFGSDAFFGAIAYIMSGKKYSTRTPISMLPNQFAWFAFVKYKGDGVKISPRGHSRLYSIYLGETRFN
ncbi:hypothetical protein M758_UG322100 [Ceratodon purpureus]|nr:hypothetical protein M758_UG322100 [Ceratodon purpureus]